MDLALASVKQLNHHIEWMPERTGVRICLMYVSCQLNIRNMKSKPDLLDDMLGVWDEAGPDELDTEGDVTLESWTGFPNPTCLLMVTLLKAPQWQTILRQWRSSSSLTWISGAAMLKKIVAAFNLAGFTDVEFHCKNHMSLVRILANSNTEKDEVVNKYCFVVWVWGARHNTTVFHKAAGELIEGRVELRARIIVYSSEMFQLAKPFGRSQVVVGVDASMEKQRFGSRSSAVATRSFKNSTNVSCLHEDSRQLFIGTSC